jgi:hypothetical protein
MYGAGLDVGGDTTAQVCTKTTFAEQSGRSITIHPCSAGPAVDAGVPALLGSSTIYGKNLRFRRKLQLPLINPGSWLDRTVDSTEK